MLQAPAQTQMVMTSASSKSRPLALERRLLRNVVLEISMLLRGCSAVPRRAIA
jgi:hypothetical protein